MIGFNDLNNIAQGIYILVICSVIAIAGFLFWITQNLAKNYKWKSSTAQLAKVAIIFITVVACASFIFSTQTQPEENTHQSNGIYQFAF